VTIGILSIELSIPHARSLKDKRQVLRSVIDRTRRHNVSVAEVSYQDVWQRAGIAIAAVASAQPPLDAMFQKILGEIEAAVPGYILRHEVEFL